MPNEAIFIGATLQGAADGADHFGPIKVPGTMSKEATIAAHREKVRAARDEHLNFKALGFAGSILANDDVYENHAQRPMTAVLASITVLNQKGAVEYHQEAKDPIQRGKVALPLINYLKEAYPRQFASSIRFSDADADVAIFGFNLKQVLRIAAFEVLKRNTDRTTRPEGVDQVSMPCRLWYNPVGVYDPLTVLLPDSDRRDLDLYSLLRYFGIQATAAELAVSSQKQAEVVRELVERTQLV